MLSRILYSSRALCTPSDARSLLDKARDANARCDITGALYLADGRFLQCLEGDDAVIAALLQRIERDRRHTDCRVLDQRAISRRVYAGWPMAWLPASGGAALMMKTIVAQTAPESALDARAVGVFFYAMAQTGECE